MVMQNRSRRTLLAGLGGMALIPRATFEENVIDLQWGDLLPDDQNAIPPCV